MSVNVYAQLSPGKLYSGHSKLEGLRNCTECHDLGKSVSNEKCLKCHVEIKQLLDLKRGYHYSKEVRKKDCAECHSDHHGEKFQIIRFDEDKFDHDLSGYNLKGTHDKIDCAKCHTSDFIKDKELKKDPDTYLGLETDCLSCHEDYHSGELDNDCMSCHDFNEFKPAPNFDHNNSEFILKGKHKKVECKDCHKNTIKDGKTYQTFKVDKFNQCINCHEDIHKGNLDFSCNSCHNENSFGISIVNKFFNHNKYTDFSLIGKHKNLDCYSCHSSDKPLQKIFNDFFEDTSPGCIKCHEDIHEGKFGKTCTECHTETSFKVVQSLENFDHNLTGFELLGKHISVDCKECHQSDMLKAVPHQKCTDCHTDFHNGEIVDNGIIKDCGKCHTEKGFSDFDFGIEEHAVTKFPLNESHQAVPCVFCHLNSGEENWKFSEIGLECFECHENIHESHLDDKFYPKKNCNNCHSETTWQQIDSFDHDITDFSLLGKHQTISCGQCHKQEKDKTIQFKGINNRCENCHTDIHFDQFIESGQTDCNKCHTSDEWKPILFDHNKSRFKLDGAHLKINCNECHFKQQNNNKEYVLYKNGKIECIDCHK